jgi:hypothetical protein
VENRQTDDGMKRCLRLLVVGVVCGWFGAFGPGLAAQELFEEATDIIPTEIERMYQSGLQYLAKTQTTNGNWGDHYGSEPAVVGLAVLAMLAHGDDPNSGPYSQPVRRGLDYILNRANKTNGYIGSSMYNHGFATLALAEAYGSVRDERLGPALEQAVALILTSQSHNPTGAWRYSPESTDADTTVSGAQMVALFAARNAGIAVPEEAIQRALQFFHQCQGGDGGFGYTSPSDSNGPRSAIGTLVLALAREKNSGSFKSAFRFLQQYGVSEDQFHQYYLYYAAQAFFQASPDAWRKWNDLNVRNLKSTQATDGSWQGNFGPVFSTAASLLSLALNYRFLPIYER